VADPAADEQAAFARRPARVAQVWSAGLHVHSRSKAGQTRWAARATGRHE
jgi:hypothetical protein